VNRTRLVLPNGSADGWGAFLRYLSVGEERDQRKQAQQSRSGAPNILLEPIATVSRTPRASAPLESWQMEATALKTTR
jgi:hypothetical protein